MQNIFVFTWEESYLLQQELHKRRDAFLQKYGPEGYISFRADDLDPSLIQNALFGGGMFSDKKLIFVRWIPKDTHPDNKPKSSAAEHIEEYLIRDFERIPQDHVVVLVCYKPDKRTKSRKFFAEHAQVKAFDPLSTKEQIAYITGYLAAHSALKVDVPYFLSITWISLTHAIHECDKLMRYAQHNKLEHLTNDQLDHLVVAQSEVEGFALLDTLFSDTKATFATLQSMEDASEDAFKTLWLLYRWIKLVMNLVSLYNQGTTDSKELASRLKTHPFPVLKQLKHIRHLQQINTQIHALYRDLLNLDYRLKTGILPQELFWASLKRIVVSHEITA